MRHMFCKITAAVALIGMSAIAQAISGALEINQACVEEGCFPGDTPGLPVTINTPGTYALTSNLAVTNTSTNVIVVQASDVTIELNGFRIVGPITCGGVPTACSPSITGGGAAGIDGWTYDPTNLVVRNGSITGMGSGLLLSYDGRAESIKAMQNGYIGIRARAGAAVLNSTGTANGQIGIEGGLIDNCVVSRNPQYGIATQGDGAVVRNVVVQGNTGYGVYLNPGAVVTGASISGNNVGIYALGGAQIMDSVFKSNAGLAIHNTQGVLAVARSTFIANNGGGSQWAGSVVQLQANLCGESLSCP